MEPFNIIETVEHQRRPGPHQLWSDVLELTSAKTADHDFQFTDALRKANSGMIVTVIPASNVNLLAFAAAGFATFEVDKETDSYASWRGYAPAPTRSQQGALAEAVFFAKYHYKWNNEDVSCDHIALQMLPLIEVIVVHLLQHQWSHPICPQRVP